MTKTEVRTAQKNKDATENRRRQQEKEAKRKERDKIIREVNDKFNYQIKQLNEKRKDELTKIWSDWGKNKND